MSLYRLIFLSLISLLSFSAIAQQKECLICREGENPVQWNASMDFLNTHLSGILVYKAETDTSAGRMVYLSKMGMRFWDMEIRNGEVKVNYLMVAFNRSPVRELIISSVPILIDGKQKDNSSRYVLKRKQSRLIFVKKDQKFIKIVSRRGFFTMQKAKSKGDYIILSHRFLPFRMELKKM